MHQQKGLSLIELMISITLGLILMTGVVQMFLGSKTTFTTQQGLSRVQETGRLAIDFIAQDVRMAGFTGFSSRATKMTNQIATPTILNNYEEGISVFSGPQPGVASLANTDILVVRGVLSGNTVPVSTGSEPGLISVPVGTIKERDCKNKSDRNNGFCADETLIIADYTKAFTFVPTGIANISATTGNLNISFDGAWGTDDFVMGAHVSAVSNVIYYIAIPDGRTEPSLFQKTNNDAALELLEGVKDMVVTYSLAKTPTVYAAAADSIGPLWKTYSKDPSLKEKNPIVGVRIQLLVQSTENNVVDTPQTYNWEGASVTAPAGDRRMYQVFTTTVALRDQLP
jgi:type IV pilus assembly protein PilW